MSFLKALLDLDAYPKEGGKASAPTYFSGLRKQVMDELLACDPDDQNATDRADLMLGLYLTFFEDPEKAPSQLRRYNAAILHLCMFMERQKFPVMLTSEFLELGRSLLELEQGTARPFLKIGKPGREPTRPKQSMALPSDGCLGLGLDD